MKEKGEGKKEEENLKELRRGREGGMGDIRKRGKKAGANTEMKKEEKKT